ncbi:hypothetical protein LguiB_013120 [Lonicera macranthoides]
MQVDDLESINVCHSSRIERIEEELRSCPRGLHCKDEVDVASTSLLITLVRVFSQIEDAEDILWVVKAITARLIDCKVDQEQSCDCEPMRRACVWAISLADRPNKAGKMEGVTTMRQGADDEDIWHVRNLHDGMRKLTWNSLFLVVFNADSVLGTDSRTSMNSQVTKPGNIAEDSSIISAREHFKTSHGYFIHPQGSKELVGSLETKWKTTNQYLLKEHAWLQCTRRCMFALVPQLNNLLMKHRVAPRDSKEGRLLPPMGEQALNRARENEVGDSAGGCACPQRRAHSSFSRVSWKLVWAFTSLTIRSVVPRESDRRVGYLRMTYLENQIPEPPPHLEETWTRALDPSGLAGFSVLGLVRPRGETEALYWRYDTDRYVVDVMSFSSDVNVIPPSTVSVSVSTDSALGMVEKVDRADQTDEFEIFYFDSYIAREERRSLAHACFNCGSSEHIMERCPFRTSGSVRV